MNVRISRLLHIAVLAVLTLAVQASHAQTWYTVEVLVFQHLGNAGLYSEYWPQDPGRPASEDTVALSADPAAAQGGTVFPLLGPSALRLSGAAGRLKRSGGYRPLLHVAWQQPGYTRSEARKVHIHTDLPNGFRTDPGSARTVDGTIRLSRARYLHVEADLLHYRNVPPDAPTTANVFRLRDSRRMRSREVHYIDHPLIGVLVLVTPIEPLEDEQETEVLSDEPSSSQ